VFKRAAKSGKTAENLVEEYRAHQEQKAEMEDRLIALRRRALEDGREPDGGDVLNLERAVAMAEAGMELTRQKLSELVATQRSEHLRNYPALRDEIEREAIFAAGSCGRMLGEAITGLKHLGLPVSQVLGDILMGAFDELGKHYSTSKVGLNHRCKEALLEGLASGKATKQERHFGNELDEIRPADNASQPGDPGFERSVRLTVDRLLDPGKHFRRAS